MLGLAIQNISKNYTYRGSLTSENKEAFDNLVDTGGVKPSWEEVEQELILVIARMAEETRRYREWNTYKNSEEEDKKDKWEKLGKPLYVPKP